MLIFDFLKTGLRVVSSPHFVYDFSWKNNSHVLFFELTKFDCRWSLFLKILSNMCIAVVCFPGFGVINFEINVIFLVKTKI